MDALCQRWGQVPSAVLAEDADIVLSLLASLSDGEGADVGDSVDPMREMLAMRAETIG